MIAESCNPYLPAPVNAPFLGLVPVANSHPAELGSFLPAGCCSFFSTTSLNCAFLAFASALAIRADHRPNRAIMTAPMIVIMKIPIGLSYLFTFVGPSHYTRYKKQ